MAKKDFSSYLFYYGFNKIFRYAIRAKVSLTGLVNKKCLETAINRIAKKHEWISKTAIYHKKQYRYVKNNLPILVLEYSNRRINLNSKKVNYHLIYLQYKEKDIYFNFSHITGGGRACNKIIFETLNEYVNLLNGKDEMVTFSEKEQQSEMHEPNIDEFIDIKPIAKPLKSNHCYIPFKDYFSLFFARRKNIAAVYEIKTNDIIKMAKSFESTPTALFAAIVYLMMARVYPRAKRFSAGILHDPLMAFQKYANYHGYIPILVTQNFNLKERKRSLQELSMIIHSSILWQTDSSMDAAVIVNSLKFNEKIDKSKFYFNKGLKTTISQIGLGLKNNFYSYFLTYTGKQIHENLTPYVKNYFYLVEGHLFFDISSFNDKFCLSIQLSKNYKKYTNVLEKIFQEYGIEYNRLPNENRYLLPKHQRCHHLRMKKFLKKLE